MTPLDWMPTKEWWEVTLVALQFLGIVVFVVLAAISISRDHDDD